MKKSICLLLLSLLAALHTFSQTQYTCDFEDSTEVKQWILNPGNQGPKCENRWHIGQGSNNGGSQGLYISSDGGTTDRYSLNADFTVAHRTIRLAPGEYELSFDLTVGGTEYDVLYVGWIPLSQPTNCNSEGMVPDWVKLHSMPVLGTQIAVYQCHWQSTFCRIKSDGSPLKLVFMWANGVGGVGQSSASIDNINIIPIAACVKPSDINMTTDSNSVNIQWTGDSDTYDFRCRKIGENTWTEMPDISAKSVSVAGLGEGVYDIYVRSDCGQYQSRWVSSRQFLFFRGNRCVDYMDLDGNDTRCFYGDYNNPDKNKGKIDLGYTSERSRHTIHYDITELDPRTDRMLHTVPSDGEASVRLGNWSVNGEAEMIEYDYYVDSTTSSILLLDYAVVLQNPGHDAESQPRFTLRILDDKGYDIGEDGCSKADFIPGSDMGDDWNVNDTIVWLDWSTIGINLSQYRGESLKIRLVTRDCSLTEHYGYAYFTVGCSDGRITALTCGTDDANKFKAPDGFFYRWYREGTPDVTYSTRQIIDVPQSDTATYYCDVIQRTNDQCYFTVSAKALPRIPHPDATFQTSVIDCQNVVKCLNRSHVIMFNGISGDTIKTDTPCDGVLWDFGDGTTSTEWEPEHIYPSEGGHYTVTMTARLADCEETRLFHLDLPDMTTLGDTVEYTTCYGEPYKFGDDWLFSEGIYHDTLLSQSSQCDSVVTLVLHTHPKFETTVSDTICSVDLPYIFGQQTLSESGTYTEVFESVDGCDSTVHLTLTVNTSLLLDLDAVHIVACAGDTATLVPYTLHSGILTSFDMTTSGGEWTVKNGIADGENLQIPLPDNILPGSYDATFLFRNMDCDDVEKQVTLHVYYAASIVTQRWNDVLGIINSQYNGGYDFVAYQWYKDGEPIPGEVSATLYEPQGLDTQAEYSVLLTRTDGTSSFSCPMIPLYYADVEVEPTVLFGGQRVNVSSEVSALVRLRNSAGLLISEYLLRDGDISFSAPMQEGVYLVEIIADDGSRRTEKIVVK